jgi:prefoldin beta subunit
LAAPAPRAPAPHAPQELEALEEGAVVYKLVGPVLIKQDLGEAKVTVKKRIDWLKAEL